tara:strand:- start:146 stop:565 length:420 start_codon:yes stop_codon:yes gene_type:complete
MKNFKLLVLIIFLLAKACYPVSHIIIGETQVPIDYKDVKVYIDYPNNYEKIAIVEASSDLAFKDISIEITHQQKTNKALDRLKKEAALLGANGIVIQDISTETKQHFNLYDSGKGNYNLSSRNERQKELTAIAILVKLD